MANHPLLIGATPARQTRDVWRFRHDDAVRAPRPGTETAMVGLAAAIQTYAETLDGPDYVLTPAVGELLSGFRTLLNGDIGRLDGGTCDSWAFSVAARIGWDLDLDEVAA